MGWFERVLELLGAISLAYWLVHSVRDFWLGLREGAARPVACPTCGQPVAYVMGEACPHGFARGSCPDCERP